MARPPRLRTAAVVREQPRVAQTASNIGVVRASAGGVTIGNTLAQQAGQLSDEFYKRAVPLAKQAGLDAAKAALPKDIMTINPETGAPEAFKSPGRLGSIASQSYQNLIERRFAESLEQEMRLKAKEYAFQSNGNAAQFTELMTHYVDSMGKNSTGKWAGYIHDAGVNLIKPTAANLALAQAKRERAAAAAAAKASADNEASTIGEGVSQGGVDFLLAIGMATNMPAVIPPTAGDTPLSFGKAVVDTPAGTPKLSFGSEVMDEALRASLVDFNDVKQTKTKVQQQIGLGMMRYALSNSLDSLTISDMKRLESGVDAGYVAMVPDIPEFEDLRLVLSSLDYSVISHKTYGNDLRELASSFRETREADVKNFVMISAAKGEWSEADGSAYRAFVLNKLDNTSALDVTIEEINRLNEEALRINEGIILETANGVSISSEQKAQFKSRIDGQADTLRDLLLSGILFDMKPTDGSQKYINEVVKFANNPSAPISKLLQNTEMVGFFQSFKELHNAFPDAGYFTGLKTSATTAKTALNSDVEFEVNRQNDAASQAITDFISNPNQHNLRALGSLTRDIRQLNQISNAAKATLLGKAELPVFRAEVSALLEDAPSEVLKRFKNVLDVTSVQDKFPGSYEAIDDLRKIFPNIPDSNFRETFRSVVERNLKVRELEEQEAETARINANATITYNPDAVRLVFDNQIRTAYGAQEIIVPGVGPQISQFPSFGEDIFYNPETFRAAARMGFFEASIRATPPKEAVNLIRHIASHPDLSRLSDKYGDANLETMLLAAKSVFWRTSRYNSGWSPAFRDTKLISQSEADMVNNLLSVYESLDSGLPLSDKLSILEEARSRRIDFNNNKAGIKDTILEGLAASISGETGEEVKASEASVKAYLSGFVSVNYPFIRNGGDLDSLNFLVNSSYEKVISEGLNGNESGAFMEARSFIESYIVDNKSNADYLYGVRWKDFVNVTGKRFTDESGRSRVEIPKVGDAQGANVLSLRTLDRYSPVPDVTLEVINGMVKAAGIDAPWKIRFIDERDGAGLYQVMIQDSQGTGQGVQAKDQNGNAIFIDTDSAEMRLAYRAYSNRRQAAFNRGIDQRDQIAEAASYATGIYQDAYDLLNLGDKDWKQPLDPWTLKVHSFDDARYVIKIHRVLEEALNGGLGEFEEIERIIDEVEGDRYRNIVADYDFEAAKAEAAIRAEEPNPTASAVDLLFNIMVGEAESSEFVSTSDLFNPGLKYFNEEDSRYIADYQQFIDRYEEANNLDSVGGAVAARSLARKAYAALAAVTYDYEVYNPEGEQEEISKLLKEIAVMAEQQDLRFDKFKEQRRIELDGQ